MTHTVGKPDHSGYSCFLHVRPFLSRHLPCHFFSELYSHIKTSFCSYIWNSPMELCLRVLKEFLPVKKKFTLKMQRSKDNCESKTNQAGPPETGNPDRSHGKFSFQVPITGGIFSSIMVVLSLQPWRDFQGLINLVPWNLQIRAMFVVLSCRVLALPEVSPSRNEFGKVRKFMVSFSTDFNACFQLYVLQIVLPFSINSSFQTDCYHEEPSCSLGRVWNEAHGMLKL